MKLLWLVFVALKRTNLVMNLDGFSVTDACEFLINPIIFFSAFGSILNV